MNEQRSYFACERRWYGDETKSLDTLDIALSSMIGNQNQSPKQRKEWDKYSTKKNQNAKGWVVMCLRCRV
jgi:hypothetical protein